MALSGKQLRHLRALAHDLKPVVQVGKNGITDGLLAELDGALSAHELIKVKLGGETPTDEEELCGVVESRLGAATAGTIGRMVLFYRRHPERPRIELPRGK